MSFRIALFAGITLFLGASAANAASCSAFAKVKSYDADAKKVEIEKAKGSESRFFPKPEGASTSSSKLPKKCSRKMLKKPVFDVKPTGGRMSVTQVRQNFSGKMINDTDDPAWLPAKLEELIKDKTTVVVTIRPGIGKDAPLGLTTIYLPITEEEKAEIRRINDQAEDL